MHRIILPRIATDTAWRASARGCLAAGLRPEDVTWTDRQAGGGLFDTDFTGPETTPRTMSVSKGFLSMAKTVSWHSDADRFDRLYSLLWRVQKKPRLMQDRADPDLAHLRKLEKGVHRCQHKMKAFVRFREIGDPAAQRRSFAAWFEPTHNTVEPTATFFCKSFR